VRQGVMSMCIELHGQCVLHAGSIDEGVRSITNLLKFRGMLRGKLDLPKEALILDPWRCHRPAENCGRPSFHSHHAQHAGVVVPLKRVYDLARKGDVLCEILDLRTGRVKERCRAGMTGGIYMIRWLAPACRKGERVLTVCLTRKVKPTDYVRKLNVDDYRNPESVRAAWEFITS